MTTNAINVKCLFFFFLTKEEHLSAFTYNNVCWRWRPSILEGLSTLKAPCLNIKQWPFHLQILDGGNKNGKRKMSSEKKGKKNNKS